MQELNRVEATHIKGWFRKNLFLGEDEVSLVTCESLVSKGLTSIIADNEFYLRCLAKCEEFMSHQSQGTFSVSGRMPESIESALDGSYWTQYSDEVVKF